MNRDLRIASVFKKLARTPLFITKNLHPTAANLLIAVTIPLEVPTAQYCD